MKKFYVAPEMEVETLELEQVLCANSAGVTGGSDDLNIGDGVEL